MELTLGNKPMHLYPMRFLQLIILFLVLFSCQTPEPEIAADTIIFNGPIYTMDESKPMVEAVAIKADTFLFVGTKESVDAFKGSMTKLIDLGGKTMTPGLVEGHAHIMGVGYNLLNVDLRAAQSYDEVVAMVAERAANTPEGTWITGRGWHQDKWTEQPEMTKGFPTHDLLSEAVPDHPV